MGLEGVDEGFGVRDIFDQIRPFDVLEPKADEVLAVGQEDGLVVEAVSLERMLDDGLDLGEDPLDFGVFADFDDDQVGDENADDEVQLAGFPDDELKKRFDFIFRRGLVEPALKILVEEETGLKFNNSFEEDNIPF